jgi:N-acetylglucosamine-6-phosphate deacetylase
MRLGVGAAVVGDRIARGDVEIADGVVQAVGVGPSGGSRIAVPGFADLPVNRFAGVDFLAADTEGFARAGKALLETGVTAYQPTLITAPEGVAAAAPGEIGGLAPDASDSARVLGAHLEGPFLSPARLGGTTMIDAVRNLHGPGSPLIECVAAASTVPARIARRADLGRLDAGCPADLVVLDDSLEIREVLRGGSPR